MKYLIIVLLIISCTFSFAEVQTIPEDAVEDQKIFWGDPSSFEIPAEVDYHKIVKHTSEYKSIKKDKIKHGTAKYWILVSKASDHAIRTIVEVGEELQYDLIAEKEYLGKLDPPIPCIDITKIILKKLND